MLFVRLEFDYTLLFPILVILIVSMEQRLLLLLVVVMRLLLAANHRGGRVLLLGRQEAAHGRRWPCRVQARLACHCCGRRGCCSGGGHRGH